MDPRICSLFLGPKAENADLVERLVLEALRDCIFWRRNFHPEDPCLITEAIKREEDFQNSITLLQQEFLELLAKLKSDIPFYSPRYIGHMLGDQLIPALVGYFAAMLHNPNNVTTEASPITTTYEREVARDLARLMGYPCEEDGSGRPKAWGHITSGGSIANFEALWVARNLKFFPFAARNVALREDLCDVEVTPAGGTRASLSTIRDDWELLNIEPQEALGLRGRLIESYASRKHKSIDEAEKHVAGLLEQESLSALGIQAFCEKNRPCQAKPPVILAPATIHYSVRKAVEALGLGKSQLRPIPVDSRFRVDVRALEDKLRRCLADRRAVLAVVSVLGTTEEGAVDQIDRIADLQEEFRAQGLVFYHHCDAAWGGYVKSLFCDEKGMPVLDPGRLRHVTLWPSEDVFRSFRSTSRTESLVIDPHKLGYVPYPCGVILFRDERVKPLTAFQAPYVFAADDEGERIPARRAQGGNRDPQDFIGRFILEGSKPGASAAACWLAHRVVPLSADGYGRIIGSSISGAQEMYSQCRNVLVPRLQRIGIRLRILTDPPDLNLFCFLFNKSGNRSVRAMNRWNREVYRRLCFKPHEVIHRHKFIISHTEFGLGKEEYYGALTGHLEALGVVYEEDLRDAEEIVVLRCTITNPWLSQARGRQDYFDEFTGLLSTTVADVFQVPSGADADGR
jgi:glutamate/tyrosine decarboxylase-like PLP-dependent enzyme